MDVFSVQQVMSPIALAKMKRVNDNVLEEKVNRI